MKPFRISVRLLALILAAIPVSTGLAIDSDTISLLNGKDLDGWKLKKGTGSLKGQAQAANGRFVIADGVLTIDPAVKGDLILETEKAHADVTLIRFEFKPNEKCNNDIFFRGMKFDITSKVAGLKVNEWNTLEIMLKGTQAEFRCNGELLKKTPKPKGSTPSPFGIRAEYGRIAIRNLQMRIGS